MSSTSSLTQAQRLAPRYQAREKEGAIEREVRLETRPRDPLMPRHGETNVRRPTIRDVAERARGSKSLVSLVMRGERMVRDDKRRRVRQAADELGYRMNLAARSLSNLRSKTIGILVADLQNPLLVYVVERARLFEDDGLSPPADQCGHASAAHLQSANRRSVDCGAQRSAGGGDAGRRVRRG